MHRASAVVTPRFRAVVMPMSRFQRRLAPRLRSETPWLRVRPARSGLELDTFARGYDSVSGYRLDPAYLARARVFVALCGGRVVGGYILNVDPPFRTMVRLPEDAQRRLAHEFPADDTVELAGVWLSPEARGRVWSAILWGSLIWRASRQNRTHVVFGTEVDRLRRLYERTGPRLLYDGQVQVDGRVRQGWVYAISAHRWPSVLVRMTMPSHA
jgi:hypothetical protein